MARLEGMEKDVKKVNSRLELELEKACKQTVEAHAILLVTLLFGRKKR